MHNMPFSKDVKMLLQKLYNKKNSHEFYIETYLSNLRRLNKSEYTIKNYHADLRKFFTWLTNYTEKEIYEVDGEVISMYQSFLMAGGSIFLYRKTKKHFKFLNYFRKFLKVKDHRPHGLLDFDQNHRFQSPLSVSSRRRHLSSIKNFYTYLVEQSSDLRRPIFKKNPVKSKMHSIKLKDMDVVHTERISNLDFEKIYENSYKTKDRLLLDLLFYGGLRIGEVVNLKFSDFDDERKVLTFVRKGGSIHSLKLNHFERIRSHLQFLLKKENNLSSLVFKNAKGQKYSVKALYNRVKKILNNSNINLNITPHSFRKACATNLYHATRDLLFVRDYLNHSDAKVTQTYIDI